jgi:hypothetical protein
MAEEHQHQEPINFSAFVLSLATTAAVHFGDIDDPMSGEKHDPDLKAARQMIDILALLQVKTKGNLDEDEDHLLSQILYELRMRYVEVRDKGQKRIIVP